MKKPLSYLFAYLLLTASCSTTPQCAPTGDAASIFPDYTDVTIPVNIAPTNFIIQDEALEYLTLLESDGVTFKISGKRVRIPIRKWKKLTANGDITVTIFEKHKDGWTGKAPFSIKIAEEIDPFISYRILPILFESFQRLSINQRNITNFREKVVYANSMAAEGSQLQCINCHSYKNWHTDNMQFHIRQYLGGTVIYTNGKLSKVNLKTDSTIAAGVYPSWHPTHNYIVYSTNKTFQNIHTNDADRIEVFDKESDLILYNLNDNSVSIIQDDSTELECYPYWSPDGKTLYYVSAHIGDPTKLNSIGGVTAITQKVRYNLYSKSFDPDTRAWGKTVLEYDAAAVDSSITHPRLSPDGRWLLCSLSTHGVFPLNQKESELIMFDTKNGTRRYVNEINSTEAESYHSWSSNGKWIVFSTRRDDGVYTRLYLAHMNDDGHFDKPFELPQKDPEFSHKFLYSFNVPEFTLDPVQVSAKELASFIKSTEAQPASYEEKIGL